MLWCKGGTSRYFFIELIECCIVSFRAWRRLAMCGKLYDTTAQIGIDVSDTEIKALPVRNL